MPHPNEHYGGIATGEVAGSITAKQLPALECRVVRLKAAASNTGKVFVGVAGVTAAAGADSTTAGWELSAGEETPDLYVPNLNALYLISSAATDDIVYLAHTR